MAGNVTRRAEWGGGGSRESWDENKRVRVRWRLDELFRRERRGEGEGGGGEDALAST